MRVTIELKSGAYHDDMVTQQEIQKNIDAIIRAIDGKPFLFDFVLLNDTRSILEHIKAQLPGSWLWEVGDEK